ncbi:ABC transporter permease [Clostridium pasteurianum]|uniref:ABC-type uncharacterized transport system, permease component n=1 Tax=Clostridium pasteurianum BC1 TaxID=86416 RepID=R4KFW6_CLOPA|nr:ABC-2 family transporter protein [Clostridium pasteurianum]AGK99444.1 ABC-type uncharacterized transport system, permease component [Clostridium pasteurianum BC1]
MKKYFEIAKITFKAELAYRFDVIIGILLSVCRIILSFILWSALFKSKDTIAGFSFNMMITYYIVISFLSKLDMSESIVNQLSNEIRQGKFSKYLVQPVKPLWYFISSTCAKTVFTFCISGAVTTVFALIFKKYLSFNTSLPIALAALCINILGLIFLMLLNYFIGILSFKFYDIGALNIIKNNIFEFITGTFIPLSLFPIWVQSSMKLFPFYYIYYYPAAIIVTGDKQSVLSAITILICWNLFMLVTIKITYKELRKRYEGVGI